ncbi:MAG: transcriptional regulator [Candidatus Thorarchaeota archaeon]
MSTLITQNTITLKYALSLVGGAMKFAEMRGVSRQAVYSWFKQGIPKKHVLALEEATKGKVSRYELRPDLYRKD